MSQQTIQQAMQTAIRCHQTGRLPEAEAIYRQVLEQVPNHPDALHLMGVAAQQRGQVERAVEFVRRAIVASPANPFFHNTLGEAYRALRLLDQAIASYERAIALNPYYAEAYSNLGNALAEKGQFAQAVAMHRKAVERRPDLAGVHNNLGLVLRKVGQLDEAIAVLRRALALQANFPDAYVNLGNALFDKGRLDEAIDAYRMAIQRSPGYLGAHINLGTALREKGLDDEAIAACRQAVALKPDFAPAHYYLGIALRQKGLPDEAIAAYDKAVQLHPDFAGARWNRSLALLLKGDFERGWAEYEWRWQYAEFSSPRRDFPQPQWKGEDAAGRAVLLHAEQGFGDTIQFIRYAPFVARRGARVIVECQPELRSLLQSMEGVGQVVAQGEPLPAFDLQAPLLSLPLAFRTTLQTVPAGVPYLRPEPALVDLWRDRLAPRSTVFLSHGPASRPALRPAVRPADAAKTLPHAPRLKIGLVWAGSPKKNDFLHRAMPLEVLGPLAAAEGCLFYSLQKGPAAAQAANPPAGMRLVDLTGEIKDFADTAALIAHLDLVISVDTAVAHLAGAMGKPVWTMVSFPPAWQWMLDREDSPWYPTMRLFRQKTRGDWAGVVERMAEELNRRAQGSGFRVQ